jgi:hypothetical protein
MQTGKFQLSGFQTEEESMMYSLYGITVKIVVKRIDTLCNSIAVSFHDDKSQCMIDIAEVDLLKDYLESVLADHFENEYTHHDYAKRYQFILNMIDYASTQTVFYKRDILNNK